MARHHATSNGDIPFTAEEESQRDTEEEAVAVEEAANGYSRARKVEYDILNQDEMRYDDVKNSTTTWVDAIDAIKVAHPKP